MYNVFTWGCTVYIMFVCVGVMNVYCLYVGECTVYNVCTWGVYCIYTVCILKNEGIRAMLTFQVSHAKRIEYILEGNLLKKCKTVILLYCFHTASVLHIFMLYKLLGPGISFYRKSKINVKRKPNYEIGWFHN